MNTVLTSPELNAGAWASESGRAAAADGPVPHHRLSVVVPMYNEIDNAAPLIDAVQSALAAYAWPWELIVVDDGSRDGTGLALTRQARRVGAHVRVLRLARNFRQTAAMQAGIDAARGDVIVTMDGDLQNDPRDIPKLVARLLREDLDLVAGWRVNRQDGLWLRKLPSRLANKLIRRSTGLSFHDLGCSLKAFRADVLRSVRLYGEMHRFIPAWLATVTSPDRMAEEAVQHFPRTKGTSKYGLSRTSRVMVDAMAMHFFLHFGARPGHFFGVLGLGIGGVGSALLAWMLALKVVGQDVGGRPMLALGFFCVLAGLQFITTGVLAELMIRVYYGSGSAQPYRLAPSPDKPDASTADGWHVLQTHAGRRIGEG